MKSDVYPGKNRNVRSLTGHTTKTVVLMIVFFSLVSKQGGEGGVFVLHGGHVGGDEPDGEGLGGELQLKVIEPDHKVGVCAGHIIRRWRNQHNERHLQSLARALGSLENVLRVARWFRGPPRRFSKVYGTFSLVVELPGASKNIRLLA